MEDALREENERLRAQMREMRLRLEEPEEIIRAIRSGEVDAFVVEEPTEPRVYALRQAELLYRAMIEEMKEGAVALDASGAIVYCNTCFARLIEVERSELLGEPIFPFVRRDFDLFFAGLEAMALGTATRRGEIALQTRTGTSLPVFAAMNPLTTEAGTVLCLILTDLRDQKRSEALSMENERKDKFLAMLAHELRNPLAPVKHATQILRYRAKADPGIVWASEVIDRQVSQLTRLVDDLLDVSRITRGKIRLELQPIELSLVIAGAVESVQPVIQARGHTLAVDLPAKPVMVKADTTRLTQVFANLLNNAAKFTADGGELSVTARVDGRMAEVVVRDNGIGIAPQMLSQVFELFVQADASLERSQGGLGLGLTLARDLLLMHGGTVEARSDGEGRGTQMVVRLPALRSLPQPARSAPRPPPRDTKRRRIVVVDDNQDAASALSELLETWGHEVITLSRGLPAFEKAMAVLPDLMFVDIGLPDIDGYEVARRIRKAPGLAQVKLVALTGYGREEDKRKAAEAGFDVHQVKPIEIDELERTIARLGTTRTTH